LGVGLLVVTILLELCTSYSSSCHHHFHFNKTRPTQVHLEKWLLKRRERCSSCYPTNCVRALKAKFLRIFIENILPHCCFGVLKCYMFVIFTFIDLTLLVGHWETYFTCKSLIAPAVGVLAAES